MNDLIILGAGPAGLTAGIYAVRYGLSTLIISKDVGGAANYAEILENYPGHNGSGMELMKNMAAQAKKQGVEFLSDEIIDIKKQGKEFIVRTHKKQFSSKALIMALGTEHKRLDIPGEQKYLGKGVSYCSACDGPLFKGKVVCVIGGSDSALCSALILAGHAEKVLLIYRKEKLRGEKVNVDKILKNKKIEVIYNSVPLEIKGESAVSSIIVDEKGKKREHLVKGVFVEIGNVPTTTLANDLEVKIDEKGYILADSDMKTSVRGVFAAGDAVKSKLKQIVTATASGAVAAKSAYEYLSLES